MHTRTRRLAPLVIAVALALAGCQDDTPSTPDDPTRTASSGRSTKPTIDPRDINWGSRQTAANRITTTIESVARQRGLQMIPYEEHGNFLDAWCCLPADLDRCDRGLSGRSGTSIRFSGLSYPQAPRDAVGMLLNVSYQPAATAAGSWAVEASYTDTDSTSRIVGPQGFQASITPSRAGPQPSRESSPANSLVLTDAPSYDFALPSQSGAGQGAARAVGSVRLATKLPAAQQLAALTTSDAAMTARMRQRLTELHAKVLAEIAGGRAQACTVGKYQGNGVPPSCPPRAMTAAEQGQARAAASAWYGAQLRLLNTRHAEMFAALQAAFPWRQAFG